jgi:5-deoxy-glucuronate isomerase
MRYSAESLVVRPGMASEPDVVVSLTPATSGWQYLSFEVRRLPADAGWDTTTGEQELAIIVLSGRLHARSGDTTWEIGGRANVFAGLPHALYLPRRVGLTFSAAGESCTFAVARAPSSTDFAPRLITPEDVKVEIRGGGNATRQINNIMPPGFPAERLVVVEVYTPGGNWSSYPPHKHDVHRTDSQGRLIEADLEEVYFYQFERPGGYAFQRIYTDPESPLHRAGFAIDAVVHAGHDDAVLVPEGYHPVVCPPGYTTYYLNVLAGSAQSLANTDDPRFAWVRAELDGLPPDPRVPIFPVPPPNRLNPERFPGEYREEPAADLMPQRKR